MFFPVEILLTKVPFNFITPIFDTIFKRSLPFFGRMGLALAKINIMVFLFFFFRHETERGWVELHATWVHKGHRRHKGKQGTQGNTKDTREHRGHRGTQETQGTRGDTNLGTESEGTQGTQGTEGSHVLKPVYLELKKIIS